MINQNEIEKKKDMKTKTKYNRTPAVYSETYYVDDIVFPSQICNKTNADYSLFFQRKTIAKKVILNIVYKLFK